MCSTHAYKQQTHTGTLTCLCVGVCDFKLTHDNVYMCWVYAFVCLHSTCIFTKPFFLFRFHSFFWFPFLSIHSHTHFDAQLFTIVVWILLFFASTSSIIVVIFLLFIFSFLLYIEKHFVTLLRQHDVFIWRCVVRSRSRFCSFSSHCKHWALVFVVPFILSQEWGSNNNNSHGP